MGNNCCTERDGNSAASNFDPPSSGPMKLVRLSEIDKDAWGEVDAIWKRHNLQKDDSMSIELAIPHIEAYIKKLKVVDNIDRGLIMSIFNEIDEDGNQCLDRNEMYHFIRKAGLKEPNQPS